MDGLRLLHDADAVLPDVFLAGVPYQITAGFAYWRLRHIAAWERLQAWRVPTIRLHEWETWEQLGDRIGSRLGVHIWHPRHWDQHYATMVDVPASTPGAVPLTRALVREKRREQRAQLALLEENA